MGIATCHCERSAATCHCERSVAIKGRVWVATAVFLLAIVSAATAKYSGGSGTAADPYQIVTAADLISLGETPDDYDKHFILTADIDLNPNLPGRKVFDRAVIGDFTGVFDGSGHTISHLTIKGEDHAGLFGQLDAGEVKDLGLVDGNIVGSGTSVAGLVAANGAYEGRPGTVTRCYSTGSVSGSHQVGGLVGENWGSVIECYSTGAVTGTQSYVGGLIGGNWGSVTECYSAGAVSGSGSYVGGLVGWNNWGSVTRCHSTGAVRGDREVGGLVGSHYSGSVIQCYSTGVVSGKDDVGGLLGWNAGDVTQCYSTCAVTGSWCVGGLVGWHGGGFVTQCYSTGTVTSTGQVPRVGGLVGEGSFTENVNNCFWNTQTSNRGASSGGKGKTTAEMHDIRTYLDAGWQFVGDLKNGTSQVWQMPDGGGYPLLAVFHGYTPPQLQGAGTVQDPYLISNAMELGAMAYYSPLAHYRLASAIDLSGIRWGTAVILAFAGSLDGAGHTISHLTISGGRYLGLFGRLESGAEVKDLGVADVSIAGSGDYVGGLAGYSLGYAAKCHSTGSVSGANFVGGLLGSGSATQCYSLGSVSGRNCVGGLLGGGSATQCYSTGVVRGTEDVGGLAGTGSATWCYSLSSVSGTGYVGGLLGNGSAAQCYSTGVVTGGSSVGGLVGNSEYSVVSQCYWDTQSSGQGKSDGGAGRTTAQMRNLQTYLDSGWDWVGEMENGTHEVWQMPDEGGYPILAILNGYAPPQLQGLGTADDPYLISNAVELGAMMYCSSDAHYRLTASIDLSGIRWGVAVIPRFAGTFDGNRHTISHLRIQGGSDLGLFGLLSGTVKNLGVVDVNITGSGGYIGALAATAGTVTQCYSTGAVAGKAYCVGGLVGHSGRVAQCYSTATVAGYSGVGGLVGDNDGQVTCSYSTGMVSGKDLVGGLIGDTYSGMLVCAASSFWDTQTSGQIESNGGTGKTTAQMQTAKTFLTATGTPVFPGDVIGGGWDFVGETKNGTDDIWWILEGKDYPHLWWEAATAEIRNSNIETRNKFE